MKIENLIGSLDNYNISKNVIQSILPHLSDEDVKLLFDEILERINSKYKETNTKKMLSECFSYKKLLINFILSEDIDILTTSILIRNLHGKHFEIMLKYINNRKKEYDDLIIKKIENCFE